ncbi:MAG TPA: OB-fold nucleic acid binding domain-containing protein [Candidatus Nanoarchaeia archaeon]|nr:OB-fold nucleic acid binding domain-containing protein [Candidatus Nanoarchaeia archaeon]
MPNEQEQFKRNIAFKLRIEDFSRGKPVIENERLSYFDFYGKKIVRVNIVGSVVEKFDSSGEKKYTFLTLDDGSGQIKVRAFGEEAEKLKDVTHGETLIIIGTLRHFNNEIYISPEIVKEQSPKYLIVRKLELEKERKDYPAMNSYRGSGNEMQNRGAMPEQLENRISVNIKEIVQETIKNAESQGGIEIEFLKKTINHPGEIVMNEVQKLLEEGVVFEPRPGKIRWLG